MATTRIALDSVPANPHDTTHQSRLQSIPASINHNGPARIEDFFTRLITHPDPHDAQLLSGTLRGFPVDGRVITSPTGMDVLVLDSGAKRGVAHLGDHEPQERVWRATHRLGGFTQWNYDQIPSCTDSLAKALTWLELAQAIHGQEGDDVPDEVILQEK
ncbi:hypothetical protein TCAL_03632 [Tigriopus californicus]|uniref:Uncharacterized protein n=1 Tax=Tigriopus californicus TaxID=6832 RepID=A0A553NE80_TIGCA|nr:uncharacterized protein LOC131888041 [Tigriopus californicus]TRY63754.1 hypothetical protein TCAL_03632 [Tigriopus californicus]|eukprot:TCALIF_03632-PA protein Name:"Similar to Rnaseh2c Ribonuclease H2 subunit C (Mus musculus)" AED:0.08 eAED:0.08 QI:0/-1/0/1/-1/1/1/0/158